jgi:hypothetical protein
VFLVYSLNTLGAVLSLTVIITFFLMKELRKKTSLRIVFWISLCDFFFSLKFLLAFVTGQGTTYFYFTNAVDGTQDPYICFIEGNVHPNFLETFSHYGPILDCRFCLLERLHVIPFNKNRSEPFQ